jgi:2-(1,2-epoxy-1,2-dihydrophenyl)acetyl-CoA isomerase
MAYEKLKVEHRGRVVVLTLNDPATLNAAGEMVTSNLIDAFSKIASGEIEARAVVLTGEGRGFCSGANLSGGGSIGSRDTGARLESTINPFMRELRDFPIPIVTAVNGPAAGIGCSFALMGDLIVAAESAYFLQAFRRIGLVPDGGSTFLLARSLGKARAMELTLLGDKLPAAKALEWGLVNRVVPDADLLDEAVTLAEQLAEGPASLGMIRRLVWQALEMTHSEVLDAERWAQKDAGNTEDNAEGVAAFREKRPAVFKGR